MNMTGLWPRHWLKKGMVVKMACKCEKYKKFAERINSIITLHSIRTGNYKLLGEDFEAFKYCPWCGKLLNVMINKVKENKEQ